MKRKNKYFIEIFLSDFPKTRAASFAIRCRAKVFAEKWHDMVLKTIGDCAGVGTLVNFEIIGNTIAVEDLVQFGRSRLQTVLIADVV